MRILVIGLNYAPDLIGIAKYTTELCEDLVARGHEVEVVTAPPYYPAWSVPGAYRAGRRSKETVNGVKLRRVKVYVPAEPSGGRRIVHLISFALNAFPAAVGRALAFKPQVVVCIAPALFSAPVALAAARIAGGKSWLHIQDFELDAAVSLGMMNGGLHGLGAAFERFLLRRFDQLSTISAKMVDSLIKKGALASRALEVRNWVDVDIIHPDKGLTSRYRQELGLRDDQPIVLYAGNMSAKQGLEILAEAAGALDRAGHPATFLFVGEGPYRSTLKDLCAGLSNTRFLDLQPLERLGELLSTADVHLLPQRPEAADLVLPSKLAPMLASGRACIVTADAGTGLANEIEGAGVVTPPGDAVALARALTDLLADAARRAELGRLGRARAIERWRRQSVIDGVERQLMAIA